MNGAREGIAYSIANEKNVFCRWGRVCDSNSRFTCRLNNSNPFLRFNLSPNPVTVFPPISQSHVTVVLPFLSIVSLSLPALDSWLSAFLPSDCLNCIVYRRSSSKISVLRSPRCSFLRDASWRFISSILSSCTCKRRVDRDAFGRSFKAKVVLYILSDDHVWLNRTEYLNSAGNCQRGASTYVLTNIWKTRRVEIFVREQRGFWPRAPAQLEAGHEV